LINSALTPIVTYHTTVFPLPKWLIKKIDKLRRNFLWKGEDNEGNKGGICLVNWRVVCRPKDRGGLDIHDLNILESGIPHDCFPSFNGDQIRRWDEGQFLA
jgi:hypothetical protein